VRDVNTGEFSPRTIDIDEYRNYGMEGRYLYSYQIGRLGHNLSAGFRLYSGKTFRYRGGRGSSGSDYDISLESGTWTADIDYKSSNAAMFVENLFSITEKFLIIPGLRYEYLVAEATGYSGLANSEPIYLQNQERGRGFLIGGLGLEYNINNATKLYANATQSYRPIQFADLTTPPTTDVVDRNLTDAQGLNVDVGYRGNVSDYLLFDVSMFYLDYSNRIGTIKQQRTDGSFYNFRTNVGDSRTIGTEAFAELNISKALAAKSVGDISVFVSYAWNDARYKDFQVVTVVNNELSESNYKDKRVEYAPENIVRTGLTYALKGFSLTYQFSFTDQVFADANNTRVPTTNGQNGLVPSYSVMDLTLGYKHSSGVVVKGGVNNLTDQSYFTRRAGGYPGPGVLPADGRTVFVTVGFVMN
jgi:Fe(3+) dicitrate transport protein